MTRPLRACIALLLVVTFAGISSALNRCIISCVTAHRADADVSVPSCHQTSSPTPHLRVPSPCGQDHGVAVTAAIGRPVAKAPRVCDSVKLSRSIDLTIAVARQVASSFSAPPPSVTSPARSAPLRL